MRSGDLPSSTELLPHIDTALDAASRWVSRGLATRPADKDGWESATYFTRVLLTRAADSFAQLGYVLQRESLQGQPEESRARVRAALAYWQEGQLDLDQARQAAKEIGDSGPTDLAARAVLSQLNGHVHGATHWVEEMTEALQHERGPDRSPPGPALVRVPQQLRADDEWDRGIA